MGFKILTQWTTNTSEEQAGFIAAWRLRSTLDT